MLLGHQHHHGHSHSSEREFGAWGPWLTSNGSKLVLASLAAAMAAAFIGLVALWPTGEGRAEAVRAAEDIGLATERVRASVLSSEDGACSYSTPEIPQDCRFLNLEVLEGPDADSELRLPEINLEIERGLPEFEPGDEVVLGFVPQTNTYFYDDLDRTNSLLLLSVLFVVIVVAFGRMRGLLALVSMVITVVVFVAFVAPSVLDGNDPVLVALIAAAVIAFVTFYLTHGVTPITTVALAGTLAALGLTFVLSWVFFTLARFTGFGSSETAVLPVLSENLNLSSLLLGGAIIGALGALDDVTITQVATIAGLRDADPTMSSRRLIQSGLKIGRDHIAATVNTLLLAYAGASLPLLLLFAASEQPLSTVANSEVIAVEIMRTLCGSIGLIAAVPLTTTLAASALPPRQAEAPPAQAEAEAEPSWDDFAPEDPR